MLLAAALVCVWVAPASATDFVVTPATDISLLILLQAEDGDRILMQPGTYRQTISFFGKSIEVIGVDGAAATILDASAFNASAVGFGGAGQGGVLEGLTITGGSGALGGGVACGDASPTIRDCVLVANSSVLGGGLYVGGGAPTIEGCTIESNAADQGGGLYAAPGGAATLVDCVIRENVACSAGGVRSLDADTRFEAVAIERNVATLFDAGGLSWSSASGAPLTGVTLRANVAASSGGGLCAPDGGVLVDILIEGNTAGGTGGGVHWEGTSSIVLSGVDLIDNHAGSGGGATLSALGRLPGVRVTLSDCRIEGNRADTDGGGAWVSVPSVDERAEAALLVERCRFGENIAGEDGGALQFTSTDFVNGLVLIADSLVAGNEAGSAGGGIYVGGEFAQLDVHRCTFVFNAASLAGALSNPGDATTITGTIVRGNSPLPFPPSQTPTVTFSNVERGALGKSNIDEDPLFADAAGGDYHLTFGSPCRDAGPPLDQGAAVTDWEGDARPFGSGSDIGADEFAPHLYLIGDAEPGSSVALNVVGVPGRGATALAVAAGVLGAPVPTPFGDFALVPPFLVVPIPPLPESGVLTLEIEIPATVIPGPVAAQALAGTALTNPLVVVLE